MPPVSADAGGGQKLKSNLEWVSPKPHLGGYWSLRQAFNQYKSKNLVSKRNNYHCDID